AAYKYGGVYQQTYEQEQAKLKRLAETSKDVQRQAEIVKGIDSARRAGATCSKRSRLRESADSTTT
ncbi:MAG: hypothetical protein M1449_07000, partial [Candidatus Thermoplasmatota archaeon]|nr:hypothetical protein [Candidatus Thermoplasmatota archaeon]